MAGRSVDLKAARMDVTMVAVMAASKADWMADKLVCSLESPQAATMVALLAVLSAATSESKRVEQKAAKLAENWAVLKVVTRAGK